MRSREEVYAKLSQIAVDEFSDVVVNTSILEGKLRIYLTDKSYLDVWLSAMRKGIYAYHWERRMVDGKIYRHNNLPDKEARKLKTFPKHFHDGSERNVTESAISDDRELALREVLGFVKRTLIGD